MGSIFPLEEFQSATIGRTDSGLGPTHRLQTKNAEELEKTRLTGYEAGYQAGWDDCVAAEAAEQSRIGAEFARNLQDLGFTFHEARSHIMRGIEPLLSGMLDKVLPNLVSETIGQTILEELLPLASVAADAPIEVVVPPSARAAIEPILNTVTAIPFILIEEPTLADGQVFLRSGSTEKHLDLVGAIERIRAAISDLYDLNEKAFKHG